MGENSVTLTNDLDLDGLKGHLKVFSRVWKIGWTDCHITSPICLSIASGFLIEISMTLRHDLDPCDPHFDS